MMYFFGAISTVLIIYYLIPNAVYRRKLCLKDEGIKFTFDDGPTPGVTDKVLEELRKGKQKSIFFVLGKKALANPELIGKILDDGHEIGLHGYVHRHGLKQTPWGRWNDLKKGIESLNALEIDPKYYRATHGFYTLTDLIFCKKYNLQPYHWWSLLGDWENPAPDELKSRIWNNVGKGRVLVLHDGCEGTANPIAMERMPLGLSIFLEEYEKSRTSC